jgi:hypothetical protein
VHQVDHTERKTVKHQILVKKDIANQNTAGEGQNGSEKWTVQRASTHRYQMKEEDFIQKTPEAALVAAQAYLLTTQPEPGDPWEHMHQAAIKSLRLVGDELKQKSLGKESTYHEHIGRSRKSQSPQTRRTNSPGREDHEA